MIVDSIRARLAATPAAGHIDRERPAYAQLAAYFAELHRLDADEIGLLLDCSPGTARALITEGRERTTP